MNTLDRVKAVIGDHLGVATVTISEDAIFAPVKAGEMTNGTQHLDFDSLDRIELAMKLEEHFGIDIPDADVDQPELGTVSGVVAYISRRLAERDALTTGTGAVLVMDGGKLEHVDVGEMYQPPAAAPDYAAMTPGEMLAECGVDGMKWTDAFMQMACFDNPLGRSLRAFPHGERDTLGGTMLGWFANAIEAGRNAGMAHVSLIDEMSDEGRAFAWRKKPVEIQAVCFRAIVDGVPTFNHPDLPDWLAEACAGPEGQPGSAWARQFEGRDVFIIGTLEGDHIANPGDWIIRGVNGEIYPCKPDIFAKTYEAVTDDGGDAHEPL